MGGRNGGGGEVDERKRRVGGRETSNKDGTNSKSPQREGLSRSIGGRRCRLSAFVAERERLN